MTYTVDLPTIGPADPAATSDAAKAYAQSRGAKRLADVNEFIDTVWDRSKAMGIRPEIAFGQWCDETGVGTSSYWINNLNPGGLRITYDGEHSTTWENGNTAALGMLHRLSLYIYGYEHQAIPDGKQYDPKPERVALADFLGIAKKLDDLSGRWAANPNYGKQIAGHLNSAFPGGSDGVFTTADEKPTGGSSVATYTVAGLGKKIELPVPLIVDLIDKEQTNQRPGITRDTPGYWVQHETANYGSTANASMHNTWLHNGASGAVLSFHFVVDDDVIYQMIPINEVTWQSADGDGPGNMSGISCELCVYSGIDTAKARHNAEALAGGIFKALGLGADRVKRHWDFNAGSADRHHCPDEMMNDNYWATFVNNVGVIAAGKQGDNTTSYAPPITYPWLAGNVPVAVQTINNGKTKVYPIGNLYTVKNTTPRKQATGNNKQETGPPLKQGEQFTARYAYRSGSTYLLTDFGTRIKAADCSPKVQITTSGVVSVRYE